VGWDGIRWAILGNGDNKLIDYLFLERTCFQYLFTSISYTISISRETIDYEVITALCFSDKNSDLGTRRMTRLETFSELRNEYLKE
jgi:hypothetical protein